jgi:hypothetical protein
MKGRSCLILGSGRSGTSLLAGTLHGAGYFIGENLVPADEGNPRGYFEDDEINAINEELLTPVTPALDSPIYGWRWLANVPLGADLQCPPELFERIRTQTARVPFCFKDPRFCYTLPVWRPFLADAVFLCVFRDPARTVNSILKECRTAAYLEGLPMDYAGAIEVWNLMYRHVLETHRRIGEWLFFHYDQLFSDPALDKLEAMLGVRVNRRFADRSLQRSPAEGSTGRRAQAVYDKLCELAGYRPSPIWTAGPG